jgi:hypothetical protein
MLKDRWTEEGDFESSLAAYRGEQASSRGPYAMDGAPLFVTSAACEKRRATRARSGSSYLNLNGTQRLPRGSFATSVYVYLAASPDRLFYEVQQISPEQKRRTSHVPQENSSFTFASHQCHLQR